MMLRTHTQTAGSTLTLQQPENNIVRAAIQALAAALGGVQSMALSCFDEAIAIPTQHAQTLAVRTQQMLQHEFGITDVADPLGGSWYVEQLTDRLEARGARADRARSSELGGAVAAIEQGFYQQLIADEAYAREQRIAVRRGRRGRRQRLRRDESAPHARAVRRAAASWPRTSARAAAPALRAERDERGGRSRARRRWPRRPRGDRRPDAADPRRGASRGDAGRDLRRAARGLRRVPPGRRRRRSDRSLLHLDDQVRLTVVPSCDVQHEHAAQVARGRGRCRPGSASAGREVDVGQEADRGHARLAEQILEGRPRTAATLRARRPPGRFRLRSGRPRSAACDGRPLESDDQPARPMRRDRRRGAVVGASEPAGGGPGHAAAGPARLG